MLSVLSKKSRPSGRVNSNSTHAKRFRKSGYRLSNRLEDWGLATVEMRTTRAALRAIQASSDLAGGPVVVLADADGLDVDPRLFAEELFHIKSDVNVRAILLTQRRSARGRPSGARTRLPLGRARGERDRTLRRLARSAHARADNKRGDDAAPQHPRRRLKVLVAEDNMINRRVIAKDPRARRPTNRFTSFIISPAVNP